MALTHLDAPSTSIAFICSLLFASILLIKLFMTLSKDLGTEIISFLFDYMFGLFILYATHSNDVVKIVYGNWWLPPNENRTRERQMEQRSVAQIWKSYKWIIEYSLRSQRYKANYSDKCQGCVLFVLFGGYRLIIQWYINHNL